MLVLCKNKLSFSRTVSAVNLGRTVNSTPLPITHNRALCLNALHHFSHSNPQSNITGPVLIQKLREIKFMDRFVYKRI